MCYCSEFITQQLIPFADARSLQIGILIITKHRINIRNCKVSQFLTSTVKCYNYWSNWSMYSGEYYSYYRLTALCWALEASFSFLIQYADRLCGLVVRVPGFRTEMCCVSCEVWTEFICHVEESRLPLWCSGQISWLQIQRSGFDSRSYQIFWEVLGLERGPLSLVSTIEKLLWRKSNGSCLESREYGRRDPSRWPRGTSISKSWH
jgi:hypothetical protein